MLNRLAKSNSSEKLYFFFDQHYQPGKATSQFSVLIFNPVLCLWNYGWCNIFDYFAILITAVARIVIEKSVMHRGEVV